mmetsp:Transcript_30655/g.94707  ORF Transcript_30655/g.94707 Transcript_30655/m.94707 type:complete len:377 (-) Transcript_30655:23-1153(-)
MFRGPNHALVQARAAIRQPDPRRLGQLELLRDGRRGLGRRLGAAVGVGRHARGRRARLPRREDGRGAGDGGRLLHLGRRRRGRRRRRDGARGIAGGRGVVVVRVVSAATGRDDDAGRGRRGVGGDEARRDGGRGVKLGHEASLGDAAAQALFLGALPRGLLGAAGAGGERHDLGRLLRRRRVVDRRHEGLAADGGALAGRRVVGDGRLGARVQRHADAGLLPRHELVEVAFVHLRGGRRVAALRVRDAVRAEKVARLRVAAVGDAQRLLRAPRVELGRAHERDVHAHAAVAPAAVHAQEDAEGDGAPRRVLRRAVEAELVLRLGAVLIDEGLRLVAVLGQRDHGLLGGHASRSSLVRSGPGGRARGGADAQAHAQH